ncbi:dihydroxyacetone kinase subunit DhaL [Halobacillus salinus]|uniref:dihydroxyacetone kinase subunit DhaL n=1 Tax=Halobacillus salinus TaxID=192814 RepID=UPI0009A6A042|nr:dihydroxyacetone kinase subunit DhaL [Halobacillus salinus]
MLIGVEETIQWLKNYNDKLSEQKDYLSQLDRAIGDGDHGINMARGFQQVADSLDDDFDDVSTVLKKTATTVMSKVGGASGPLYGTAFLKMSMACKGKEVDAGVFAEMVEAALGGIKQRGKSEEGEKTMVDVWSPVLDMLHEGEFDAERLKKTAEDAMQNTEDMTATKGRASYFKERSQGNLDPGAVSSYYLFAELADVIGKGA